MANILKSAVKSIGSTLLRYSGEVPFYDLNEASNAGSWRRYSSDFSFGFGSVVDLFETGYMQNPIVFGIVTKVQLSSINLKLVPYRNGKPILSKSVDFDLQKALVNLLTTGTCIIYKYENIGFGYEYDVIDTVCITEQYYPSTDTYRYFETKGGRVRELPYENLTFTTIYDNPFINTNLGISPLQAACMPLETIREMYIADGYLLKNKGGDYIISSGSDEALANVDQEEFDEGFNNRVSGSRKTGKAITSTANIKVDQLGRSIKDLALWDGYKIKARDIATALQVSTSVLNDPDNKQYSNAIEGRKALYEECVIPFTKLITGNKKVQEAFGFEIWVDTSDVECLQESQERKIRKNKLFTDAIVYMNTSVKSGNITKEIAVFLLVNEWGYDEEEAAKLISNFNNGQEQPTTEDQTGEQP